MNWRELLGWEEDEINDLRFVGYSYVKQGHYEIARLFFETLVILSEQSEYDLQTLGAIYLQLGNNLAALNYLDKALKINPVHGPTLLNKAKALFLLGYRKQALIATKLLEKHEDPIISSQASALVLAYS